MATTFVLAEDRAVEVQTPADPTLHATAARYATLAFAAKRAAGGAVSNVGGWIEATHRRACRAAGDELRPQMAKWASATRDRFELLGPVCDLLIRRSRRVGDTLVNCSEDVPLELEEAAVTLFGHPALSSGCADACRVCAAAREGDWTRALRLAAGDQADLAAAALADAYRAARRGGVVPAVLPDAGASGGYWSPRPSSSPSASGVGGGSYDIDF